MKIVKKIYRQQFVLPSRLGYDIVDVAEAEQTRMDWEDEGVLSKTSPLEFPPYSDSSCASMDQKITLWRMERIEPWGESFRFPIGELELVCIEPLSSRGVLFKDGWGDHYYKQLIDAARDVAREKEFDGSNHYIALSEPRFTGAADGSSLVLVQFYVPR